MANNDTKYTQRTGAGYASSIADPITNKASEFSKPITTLHNEIADAYRVGSEGMKLTLSNIGISRQHSEVLNGVKTGGRNDYTAPQPSLREYETQIGVNSPLVIQRQKDVELNLINDPINDCIFACGNYFAPLNITFSGSASKVVAESQLVDGINIIERIANAPLTVNVSFIIERLNINQPIDKSLTMTVKDGDSMKGVYKLTSFLRDLYYNDEVFEISNPVLNNEFGMEYAFIKSFNFNPEQGSTFMYISFVLQEVNIKDPLLYTNPDNAPTYRGVPTSK